MRNPDVISLMATSEEAHVTAFCLAVYTLMCYFNEVHVYRTHLGCTGVHGSVRMMLDGTIAIDGRLFATEARGLSDAGEAWETFINR